MIRGKLVHPELLHALAAAGHGSKILISDFNYSHAPRLGPNASIVYANFAPGLLRATDVLKLVCQTVPVENVEMMEPMREGPYAVEGEPEVWSEYRNILREYGDYAGELEQIERFAFYDVAAADDICLTIATGETAFYANVLLTIGAFVPQID